MRKPYAVTLLLLITCTSTVDEEPPVEAGQEVAGEEDMGEDAKDLDTRSEEDLREEVALLAERDDIEKRLKEGRPMPEDEPKDPEIVNLSEYQRWLRTHGDKHVPIEESVPGWLRLARWCMSEGPKDCGALLQMANVIQRPGEPIGNTIARRAPHVSRLREPKAGRQLWTSTLVPGSLDPPPKWFECKDIYQDDKGRWRRKPYGCHGVWEQKLPQWVTTQALAKEIINTKPHVVQGDPIDQGGIMDVWRVLELPQYKHLCFIGQPNPPKGNLFYGERKNPKNTCLPVPGELVAKSKTISVALMLKRERFKKAKQRARAH